MNIIEIRGGGFSAKINADRGGNCISLIHHASGAHILREPDYSAPLDNPFLYGMPLLFPVNRISGGTFTFEGREYRFPINEPATGCFIHGTLHETPFAAADIGEDHVRCTYRADAAHPYHGFPHDFSVELTYSLAADGLTLRTKVTNHSDTAMPLMIGFHTTFNVPFLPDGRAEDVRVLAEVGETIERGTDFLPTGHVLAADETLKQLCAGDFAPAGVHISRHCDVSGTALLGLCDRASGHRVIYRNDAAYAYRLIFKGEDSPFICLEPQNCGVDCANSPLGRERAGFSVLPAGGSAEMYSQISFE